MSTLPQPLDLQLRLVLDNLSLAHLIAVELLRSHQSGPFAAPTEVRIHFPGNQVAIPGMNCGFITTPVVHNALLDIRRLLEFFGLKSNPSTGVIEQLTKSRYRDDYSLADIGLTELHPDSFSRFAQKTIGKEPHALIHEVVRYTNKEMAHFSKTAAQPDLASVIDATFLMKKAILFFVYDGLGLPHPPIQPKNK